MMRLLDELAVGNGEMIIPDRISSPPSRTSFKSEWFRHKLIEVITPNDPDPRKGRESFFNPLLGLLCSNATDALFLRQPESVQV